jgi:hypothetical protein
MFLGNPTEKSRRNYIHNVVICSVVRACAVFDYHINGGRDPDLSPEPSPSQRIDRTVSVCFCEILHTIISHRSALKAKIMLMEYEDQSKLISSFIELADCFIASEQE